MPCFFVGAVDKYAFYYILAVVMESGIVAVWTAGGARGKLETRVAFGERAYVGEVIRF